MWCQNESGFFSVVLWTTEPVVCLMTTTSSVLCVYGCVFLSIHIVCVCALNENHIRCSLILCCMPWRGGRCFRSRGLWFSWTGLQSDTWAEGERAGGGGRTRSQSCCQNWSDTTSPSDLHNSTCHQVKRQPSLPLSSLWNTAYLMDHLCPIFEFSDKVIFFFLTWLLTFLLKR